LASPNGVTSWDGCAGNLLDRSLSPALTAPFES
jgi:hypothetical protein